MTKVHLILVDGMRSDALLKSGSKYISELLSRSLYTLSALTVYPSITLPCHMSLIHSVGPDRHGITTNIYSPQVRPVKGLFEMLSESKSSAFAYNWEELRDLSCPGSLSAGFCCRLKDFGGELSNNMVTDASISFIKQFNPDFLFSYLGWTDIAGHNYGWMSDKYMDSIDQSFCCIERLITNSDEDTVNIITSDHGGHLRNHGSSSPEDMTIPVIIYGKNISPGIIKSPVSILDIAPTICELLGCPKGPEWEGHSIL